MVIIQIIVLVLISLTNFWHALKIPKFLIKGSFVCFDSLIMRLSKAIINNPDIEYCFLTKMISDIY